MQTSLRLPIDLKKGIRLRQFPYLIFKDTQGEVALTSPLKASEITALTGASSPFGELCEQADIPKSQRDDIFKNLVQSGDFPGELRYTRKKKYSTHYRKHDTENI